MPPEASNIGWLRRWIEAVLRWNHPERGMISPARFIFGSYDPIRVAVNIFAQQFAQIYFVGTVAQLSRVAAWMPDTRSSRSRNLCLCAGFSTARDERESPGHQIVHGRCYGW